MSGSHQAPKTKETRIDSSGSLQVSTVHLFLHQGEAVGKALSTAGCVKSGGGFIVNSRPNCSLPSLSPQVAEVCHIPCPFSFLTQAMQKSILWMASRKAGVWMHCVPLSLPKENLGTGDFVPVTWFWTTIAIWQDVCWIFLIDSTWLVSYLNCVQDPLNQVFDFLQRESVHKLLLSPCIHAEKEILAFPVLPSCWWGMGVDFGSSLDDENLYSEGKTWVKDWVYKELKDRF